ncbi:hypothetical protein Taro_013283 [Colocasia esculenta]|uniref:Uncharacterized protein n=1 Tax=Colocasia esculenta TaxID=4460 RepID=A0A843UBE4_COLES|nr:hypothetical protein [Colocasia esculenta]
MGNCNVTGGNMVGCSLRGGTGAAGCSAHRAAAVLAPRHRAGARVRVRVMADSGRVTEFDAPIQAGDVLAGHPRHGVFRVGDVSSPLPCREQLQSGRLYYLLPLDQKRAAPTPQAIEVGDNGQPRRPAASKVEPWPELGGSLEVLTPPMKGVWRIKLVMSAEQLAGILAEQDNTEALIERMRMLACRAEAMATAQAKQQGAAARKAPPALSTLSHAHHTLLRLNEAKLTAEERMG